MNVIHIFNPAAGNGTTATEKDGYLTKSVGDCRRFVAETCGVDPTTHFLVHGGDGTLNEAVSGIVDAGAGQSARLTCIPAGSGNDTVKSLADIPGEEFPIDLYACNDRHGINMINIGFDCNVVSSAAKFKQHFHIAGSLSYILGIVTEFFKHFGWTFSIHATLEDGSPFNYEGDCLLCAICNGQWCGGGFHNSPLSDMQDGVLELLLVKKVSRLKFLTLISKYKDGTLVDPQTGEIAAAYAHLAAYKRIRSVSVTGTRRVCLDGEVIEVDHADVHVMEKALLYRKN